MIKELETLVGDLKRLFKAKEVSLKGDPNFSPYTEGFLRAGLRDIENFQLSCINTSKDPLLKDEIVRNFKKDFAVIKSGIDKITC